MQYWPPALDKTEVYGDIHIGIVNEEQLANFQIRTFRIWKENAEVRTELKNSTSNIYGWIYCPKRLDLHSIQIICVSPCIYIVVIHYFFSFFIYITESDDRRATDPAISLYRMAFAHMSFFQCRIGIPQTCPGGGWQHHNET